MRKHDVIHKNERFSRFCRADGRDTRADHTTASVVLTGGSLAELVLQCGLARYTDVM